MLDKLDKKSNPFKVPENYFENFNAQIMEQLPEKKTAKVVPLWKKALPWTAVAAVFAGIIMFAVPMLDQPSQTNGLSSGYIVASEDDFYQYVEDEVVAYSYRDMIYDEANPN